MCTKPEYKISNPVGALHSAALTYCILLSKFQLYFFILSSPLIFSSRLLSHFFCHTVLMSPFLLIIHSHITLLIHREYLCLKNNLTGCCLQVQHIVCLKSLKLLKMWFSKCSLCKVLIVDVWCNNQISSSIRRLLRHQHCVSAVWSDLIDSSLESIPHLSIDFDSDFAKSLLLLIGVLPFSSESSQCYISEKKTIKGSLKLWQNIFLFLSSSFFKPSS